jgi:hypothetical protein
MEITLTTPALLFPAITLLLLAFTNRFLGLSALIRNLHETYVQTHSDTIAEQIDNLRRRVILIRNMQVFGVASILSCVLCMFVLFKGWVDLGKCIFGVSLVLLMASLALSLWEIWISVRALNLHLGDLAAGRKSGRLDV